MITVAGAGRIGGMMVSLARGRGEEVAVVGRGGPIGAGEGPILVCTRNDDLEDVLGRTEPARRADLVFVQNGVVAPWARAHGLAAPTVGVLYIAVDRVGATPVPGASSPFHGPHAAAVVTLLRSGGLPAHSVDEAGLREEVGLKLAWICVLGVLGQALAVTAGEVVSEQPAAVRALCEELRPVLRGDPDTDAPVDLVERVMDYSRSVAHYRTTVKEWPWRTGWLLASAQRQGIPLPLHREWLRRAGFSA